MSDRSYRAYRWAGVTVLVGLFSIMAGQTGSAIEQADKADAPSVAESNVDESPVDEPLSAAFQELVKLIIEEIDAERNDEFVASLRAKLELRNPESVRAEAPDMLKGALTLIEKLRREKRFERAERTVDLAMTFIEQASGKESRLFAIVEGTKAKLLSELRSYADAQPLFEHTEAILFQSIDTDIGNWIVCCYNLHNVYTKLGMLDEAARLEAKIDNASNQAEPGQWLKSMHTIAAQAVKQILDNDSPDDALLLANRLLKITSRMAELAGDHRAQFRTTAFLIGRWQMALGDHAEAEGSFDMALGLSRSLYGKYSPEYVEVLDMYTRCRLEQGRRNDAIEKLQSIVEIQRELHGDDHPKYEEAVANMMAIRDKIDVSLAALVKDTESAKTNDASEQSPEDAPTLK